MNSPQVFLVEGADGVGKSTFAQRMVDQYRAAGIKATIIHNGPPGDITKLYDLYLLQIKRAVSRRNNFGEATIIDRSFLSEAMYGPFRDGSKLTKRQVRRLEHFCKKHNIILLGLDADLATRRERIEARGEEFSYRDIMVGVLYRKYFQEKSNPWITADSVSALATTESN